MYSMYTLYDFNSGRKGTNEMEVMFRPSSEKRRLFHQSGSNSITEIPLLEVMRILLSFSEEVTD